MRTLAPYVLLSALVTAGCGGESPSSPSPGSLLRLTASATHAVLPPGEVATVTFRLENAGTQPVDLSFPSACQVSPYIAEPSGKPVYPPGGGWDCAQVLTSLTLEPGGSRVETLRIAGGTGSLSSAVGLPAGDYVAYARMEAQGRTLQSDKIPFSVR